VKLGTRHRAGIGISEETDCLSIIVSEETGLISIASFGELERGVTIERVDERIFQHFGVPKKKIAAGGRATGADTEPLDSVSTPARMRD
jgi:diadenylate cyclase